MVDSIGPLPRDTHEGTADFAQSIRIHPLLSQGGDVALLNLVDAGHNFKNQFSETDAYRAAIVSRALLFQVASIDELVDVVENVGILIISALDEVANYDLFVADVGH